MPIVGIRKAGVRSGTQVAIVTGAVALVMPALEPWIQGITWLITVRVPWVPLPADYATTLANIVQAGLILGAGLLRMWWINRYGQGTSVVVPEDAPPLP